MAAMNKKQKFTHFGFQPFGGFLSNFSLETLTVTVLFLVKLINITLAEIL